MKKNNQNIQSIKDIENEKFLCDKIKENFINKKIYYEWSKKSPYYMEINGKIIKYENSYIAHLEKHPKNKEEEFVWKKQISDFPNNIEKKYLEFSQNIIAKNYLSYEYDNKNHSLNFDIEVEIEDGKYEKIRTSLKRDAFDKEKLVITTCHPRIKREKYYYFLENGRLVENYYCMNIDTINRPKILQDLFIYSKSDVIKDREFADLYEKQHNKLEQIIKKYLINSLVELEYLEYYKKKYENFEFTDLFDYENIKKNIENLFLCEKFYDLEYSNDQFEMSENFCTDLVKRFLKLDDYNNIQYNININCRSELKRMYLATRKMTKLHKASSKCLNDLISKYPREDGDYIAKGKSYQIQKEKFSHSRDETRNEFLTHEEIFVFGKWNKIPWDEITNLLARSGKCFFIPYLEENNVFIDSEWDREYDDDRMLEVFDLIKGYRSSE